ncbi:hypothetical protein EU508_00695 [Pseudoalteromonas fuliginea]|uniref:Uncharacterized protein n=1 Tax=Pseudoalteromonas fuliginea TaxID=1872678 RepID=A0AB73BLS7_9GAMM|nr:hypothetical protein [Pseudoalteromonas fuliginea]KAA1165484.1 hypothetical protein EU508_00695 [Pseudoalteromonas fuliginea]
MIVINAQQLDNFVWLDELDYSAVAEQSERALNGAQHIEKTIIPAGRSINLYSDFEAASVFNPLFEHANTTLSQFEITIRGTVFNVVWDHSQKAVEGTPHTHFSDSAPTYFQNINLRLKTV